LLAVFLSKDAELVLFVEEWNWFVCGSDSTGRRESTASPQGNSQQPWEQSFNATDGD